MLRAALLGTLAGILGGYLAPQAAPVAPRPIPAPLGLHGPPAPAPVSLTWKVAHLDRITAYNAVAAQTDNDPLVASCGSISAAPGRVIAVSRDLFFDRQGRKRCGAEIAVVYADGRVVLGVVWDTMNKRYKNTADILMDTVRNAKNHGVQAGQIHFLD